MRFLRPLSPPARDERGFSLIEMLVAMLSATVIAGALFAILNFSTSESSTLSDKVQADETGRTAMTRIDDELHSACVSPTFVPIQQSSSENELRFENAYSNTPVIEPSQVELHEIVWTKSTGTLIEYRAKSTGGTVSEGFTFSEPRTEANRKKFMIATNVGQNEVEGKKVPIFQYFSYAPETTESEKAPLSTLNTTSLAKEGATLGKTEAGEAASVLISFNQAGTDNKTAFYRSVALSSQVTFAFAVPNAETPIHDSPCQ